MKKIRILISLLILPILFIPFVVNGEDTTIKITTKDTNFKAGNIITVNVNLTSSTPIGNYEYTLDFDSKKLKLLNSNSYVVNSPNNNSTKKVNKSFKFKILKDRGSKISVNSYSVTSFNGSDNLSVNVIPLTLGEGANNTNSEANVYLKSLEVEGAKLSPEFNKDTTKYEATLESNSNKINIIAKANDSSYEIKGDGEFEVTSSDNSFDVTVSDDDDNSKTYTITFNKSKAIKVKVDGKEYTIVEDASKLENIPAGFKKKKLTIEKQEITGLYNEKTNQTLVALKDEEGKIELFLYDTDKGSYSKYDVINFNKMSFIPIKTNKTIKGYHKDKVEIDNKEINCLKLNGNSEFSLIYGMNTKNGDKGWYSYESISNTLQKYNDEIEEHYKDKDKNTRILIYILSGTSILFGILVIILAVKLSQRKKRY